MRAYLRRRPFLADLLLAGILTGLGLFSVWMTDGPLRSAYQKLADDLPDSTPLWYVSMLAMSGALCLRRRAPVIGLAVTFTGFAVFRYTEAPETLVSGVVPFISIYSAGVYGRRRASVVVRAACLLAAAALLTRGLIDMARHLDDLGLSAAEREGVVVVESAFSILYNLAFFAAAWLLGDAVRRRREREAELAERAAELERANAVIAQQAVVDERLRIARELHDVVAHHVSVIGIQAGAARKVLSRDPERTADLIVAVEESSRQTVGELHQLLGFLRREPDGDHADERSPQPTLTALTELLDRMRSAGLDVSLDVTGDRVPLPDAVELSAFRIVQEALTNTLKHAGPRTRVRVELAYRAGELDIVVQDSGPLRAATVVAGVPGGRGLIGMRERAGVHGGRLAAGPRPGGGYEVRATIPV